MEVYLILQLVNNPIYGAQQALERNLPIAEAHFCATGRRNSTASRGPPGMGPAAPQHEIPTAQATCHTPEAGPSRAVSGARGRGRLAVSCQAALDCGKAQHCRKGRCSVFYVGGHVCVYITNTMLYTHTHM